MSLEDDLRAQVTALISQQMANWVVEIQRQIQSHQANFVQALDDLVEGVARYDERFDEATVETMVSQVLAANPAPPPAATAHFAQLAASLLEIEKGASLAEVLTSLVNEASTHVERVAMFILRGTGAIGWYGRGVEPPEAVKQVNIPLTADTAFRAVNASRQSLSGHVSGSPGTSQALARLGGHPQGFLAIPLILRDKVAAVLWCDTSAPEIDRDTADILEILVRYAGKCIDLVSAAPKTGAVTGAFQAGAPASAPPQPTSACAFRGPSGSLRCSCGASRPPHSCEGPAIEEVGVGTVMFRGGASSNRPATTPPMPAPRLTPPAGTGSQRALTPELQKAHEEAKRFARLVVSEIKLYNESKVNEGRKNRDLYERLKEDIERGRQLYEERVPAQMRETTNYFFDELVRTLAAGDPNVLGPM